MKLSKLNLRNLFAKGLMPNQDAFYNWMDSYWHRDEEIDITAVKGLENSLKNKLDVGVEEALLKAVNDAVNTSKSIVKGEATPTSSPTPWTSGNSSLYEKWEVRTAGTYTNFKDSASQPIIVSALDLDKNFVYINVTNGVAKKDTVPIPGVIAKIEFDPLNNIDTATMKAIDKYFSFNTKSFNYVLDFSKDNFGKYTQLISTVNFSEGTNGSFGKICYVKLTGGNVNYPSNFVPQLGSTDYNPAKTNVIAFWKEYDKVRFFNEVFPLEPIPSESVISTYNFQNQVGSAALSTVTPIGSILSGNVADHSISASGQFLRRLNNAISGASAVGINLNGVKKYKASFLMSIVYKLDILVGGTSYDNYTNYIRIEAQSPSSLVKLVTPSSLYGVTIATTPNIPYPQNDWFLWEFIVNNQDVEFYCNGKFIVKYNTLNTGDFFSFILNNTGDGIKMFNIEKL